MTPRPTRKQIWRKRITRALLCLLLGAVTTVGVAWGCEWSAARGANLSLRYDGHAYVETRFGYARFAETRYGVVAVRRWEQSVLPIRYAIEGEYAETRASSHLRITAQDTQRLYDAGMHDWRRTPLGARAMRGGWGRLPTDEEEEPIAEAAGWPCVGLWQYRIPSTDGPTFYGELKTGGRDTDSDPIRLPLLIAWPGFLLDTLFYAAPWWLILIAPGAIRRMSRRRRSRCIDCGYDLAGLRTDDNTTPTCPECGT